MENIVQGVLSRLGVQEAQKIGETVGLNGMATERIIKQAGPLLISAMAKNSKDPAGRNSLGTALESHDASIFNKVNNLIDPRIDTKGHKMLGHILGDKVDDFAGVLAQNNTMKPDQTKGILEMITPLVLGEVGQQKKDYRLGTDGIVDLLQAQSRTMSENKDPVYMQMAKQFLDKNGNGSLIDEGINFIKGFLNKK